MSAASSWSGPMLRVPSRRSPPRRWSSSARPPPSRQRRQPTCAGSSGCRRPAPPSAPRAAPSLWWRRPASASSRAAAATAHRFWARAPCVRTAHGVYVSGCGASWPMGPIVQTTSLASASSPRASSTPPVSQTIASAWRASGILASPCPSDPEDQRHVDGPGRCPGPSWGAGGLPVAPGQAAAEPQAPPPTAVDGQRADPAGRRDAAPRQVQPAAAAEPHPTAEDEAHVIAPPVGVHPPECTVITSIPAEHTAVTALQDDPASSSLWAPVVPLDLDALGPPGRGLVVVLLVGELLLRRDVGIVEHLEGVVFRGQPDRAVRLLDRAALGRRLLHGQLGQRVGLQPLVGDRPAAAHRPAVVAGGQPRLCPLQRRPPLPQELVDCRAGLLGVAPVGVVDLVAQVGRLRLAGLGRQQPLEPGSFLGEQCLCVRLVHLRLLGPVKHSSVKPRPTASGTWRPRVLIWRGPPASALYCRSRWVRSLRRVGTFLLPGRARLVQAART